MLNSNELIDKVKSYNKFLDPKTLSKAYDFALKAHEKQKREEGRRATFWHSIICARRDEKPSENFSTFSFW